MNIEIKSENKSFDGLNRQYTHRSNTLDCDMQFGVFLPEKALQGNKLPVLFWLSGLTCTDENFMQKSGIQKIASKYNVIVVAPDTSPRGESVPDDVDKSYDFGLGAGFYINATQEPWKKNYQMYSYILEELIPLVDEHFPVDDTRFISGHSMGGHGALTIGLKNSELFKSISAFSPICNPSQVPWGIKAFSNYLGDDKNQWKKYDALELVKNNKPNLPILVDQGSDDVFYAEQLSTVSFQKQLNAYDSDQFSVRIQEGYDHSYYFIATFLEEHIKFHLKSL
ncbi:S-formylglutathione hydrolase [Paraphotobacterium marinum]|uniref:S-formylglutathione hydrolase n=1 Tax=Paraphotobacterium marinum TaxID=1755811 RepID=A0A220VEV6_9GAMM|nr:S-formylglutathione hydrolase [Paraphotobacterium marinum]ASK78895.1 S-formylglutathione hydrolase [Paraphotobacterium marinum]